LVSVLHVEPNGGIRAFLKQRLEEVDGGFTLHPVAGAADAITACTRDKIDVILLRHSPLINAVDLTKTLKGVTRVPIVIYTTEEDDNLSNQAIDVGADAYLMLELSQDQPAMLARRIKAVIERRRGDDLALAVLEAAVEAVVVERDGRIIFSNSVFEGLIGGSRDEFIGSGVLSLISEADRAKAEKLLKAGGDETLSLVTYSGERRVCKVHVQSSKALGSESHIISVKDATEENLHEHRIKTLHEYAPRILGARTRDELARNTLDAVDAGFDADIISFLLVDGDGLVCIERRWKADRIKLPLSGDGSIVKSVRDGKAIRVNDIKDSAQIEDLAIKSELSLPIRNGEVVSAILNMRSGKIGAFSDDAVAAAENLCLYVGCAFHLLSELQTIKNSETQYRELLESLGDAVYVIVDSRYAYVNRRGAELLGYSKANDLIGKDVFTHVAVECREVLINKLEKWQNEGATDAYELKVVKLDGSQRDMRVNASSIVFDAHPAYLAIEEDVTDLKQMQEQIKKYATDLEQKVQVRTQELLEAQQFAAAGKLASMVGHDLRSPLQSIRNATYLMRKQPGRGEEMLGSIEASVDRALAMIEDLRYRTRETPLKVEATNLHELIVDILKEAPVQENVQVDIRLDPELKFVDMDSLKMRRVIDNLVRNALEAMPSGGRLTVETKYEMDKLAIVISDTGVGIPKDNFPNLFRPFYTTKSNGLGLGLAYSLKAVEAHGGTIKVESDVGRGTAFKILLTGNHAKVVEATES